MIRMVKGKNPFQTITLKLSDIQIKQSLHKYKHTYKKRDNSIFARSINVSLEL